MSSVGVRGWGASCWEPGWPDCNGGSDEWWWPLCWKHECSKQTEWQYFHL